MRHPEIQLR